MYPYREGPRDIDQPEAQRSRTQEGNSPRERIRKQDKMNAMVAREGFKR